MLSIDRRSLAARERKRWRLALASTPIVARPRPPAGDLAALGLLVASGLLLGTIVAELEGAWYLARALSVGLSITLAAAVRWWWREAGRSRDAWTEGRFLYAWGYVEIDGDILTLRPAAALSAVLHEAQGERAVLACETEAWASSFVLAAGEIDGVRARLARLGTEQAPLGVAHGYRDAAAGAPLPPLARGRRAIARAIEALGLVLFALAVVAGTGLWSGAVRDVRDRPLTSSETELQLGAEVLDVLRERFGATPAVDVDLSRCVPRSGDAALTVMRRRVALPQALQILAPPFVLPGHLHTWSRTGARARLYATCSLRRLRHDIALDARWTLVIDGERVRERTATISADQALAARLACRRAPLPGALATTLETTLLFGAAVVQQDVLRVPRGVPVAVPREELSCMLDAAARWPVRVVPLAGGAS